MKVTGSFALKVRRDPIGDPMLIDDDVAVGLLWIGISCIPVFFGVIFIDWDLLKTRLADASGIMMVMFFVLLPFLGILGGLHLVLCETCLVFRRSRQQLIVRKKRLGLVDEKVHAYMDVDLVVIATSRDRLSYVLGSVDYEATIYYPSGNLKLAQGDSRLEMEAFRQDLLRITGLEHSEARSSRSIRTSPAISTARKSP